MGQTSYKEVNPEVFNRNLEAARSRKTGGGGDFWKPAVGKQGQPAKSVIRILPPHVNMDDVIVEAKVHFSLGPKEDSATLCLRFYKEDCPVCEVVDQEFKEARAETDPEAKARLTEKARNKSAKLRFFANVVDMQKPENGVQRYAFGPDVEKKIRNTFCDDDGNFRDVSHPKKGRDLIMFVGKKPGDFNDYEVRAKEAATPLADMSWLDQITDLSDLTKKPTLQDVTDAMNGIKRQKQTAQAQQPVATKPVATPAQAPIPGRAVGRPAAATAKKEEPKADDAKAAQMEVLLKQMAQLQAVMAQLQGDGSPKADAPEPEAVAGASPVFYAAARAAFVKVGFHSAIEMMPGELDEVEIPDCYTKLADPLDGMCRGCRLLLDCYTRRYNLEV